MTTDAYPGLHEELVHVFVSYAREDKRWLDPDYRFNLVPFLMESLRRHNVVFWFDTELKPGDEFKRNIETEIDQAQIALLIVSQHFLNSEFIESREMPRIAERASRGQMIVIPVLVEPCDWTDYPFLSDRQMVPSSPLIDYTVSDPMWAKVKYQILDGLKAQLKRLRESGQTPATEVRKPEGSETADPQHGPQFRAPIGPATVIPEPFDMGKVPRVEPAGGFGARPPNAWPQTIAPPALPSSPKIPHWALGLGISVVVVCGIYAGVYYHTHQLPAVPSSTVPSPSTEGGTTGEINPASTTNSLMQPYTSSGGRFTALFPGTPQEQTHEVNLPNSQTTTLYQFYVSLDNDNIAYTVMYNDYPDEYTKTDPQTILEGARDGATKGRTLTDDEVISLNGIPGRAIVANGSDGYAYSAHLYLDGARLYQVVVVSNKDHPATYTEQFLNSFKVF
jgi:hypothetical protein